MMGFGDLAAAAKHAERLAETFGRLVDTVTRLEAALNEITVKLAEQSTATQRVLAILGERK